MDAFTLTVVGCSGSLSGPDSPASGYLVQTGGPDPFSVLLDCGPGVAGALFRSLEPAALGAVALSHLHADHCVDLTGLYVALRWSPPPRRPTLLPVHGPPGTLVRIARAYDAGPDRRDDSDVADLDTVFEERVWAAEQQIGPFHVRTTRTAHPVHSVATRFEAGGASLVFTGDTGPSEAVVELARGADLLLCEAAFAEPAEGAEPNPTGLHLTGAEAGDLAARAGVGRLVLTHIPPWYDPEQARAAAARHYGGPIDLAIPGARYRL